MNLPAKSFLQYYKLTISTLSPVHIGCGEDYEPTNYVMDGQCLHYFDLVGFADFLTDDDRKELSQISQERDPMLRLQKFISARKNQLIPLSSQTRTVALGLFNKYEKVVGKAANIEQNGKKIINALEIARTAYNPHSQEPIIPGSSIKGSIRTALLNGINSGKKSTFSSKEARKLENDLLQGGFERDPLRLIKLGDAYQQKHENVLHPHVLFENNIKRTPPAAKPARQLLSLMREVIPEFNSEAFTAGVTIQDLLGISTDKTPNQQFSIGKIVEVCNQFYLEIFTREQLRLRQRGCLNTRWDHIAQESLSLIKPFIETGTGMLLRIGRHSGAESVTLDGVRSIKIMKGPGKRPDYQPEATTDWLACEEEKSEVNLMPFGWVFIDLNYPDMHLHRQELKAHLHRASFERHKHQKSLFEDVNMRREQLKSKQQALLKEEQLKKERQLAEQKAEEDRKIAIAAMSPEEQDIMKLKQRLQSGEGKNQGAGCLLAGDLRKLVESASNWSKEHRSELHALCLELFAHLNIDEKKVKWKAQLKALENP